MYWAPSPSQPLQGGMLGFLPYWYYGPNGFNFGGDDGAQPIIDDPDSPDNNVADVVKRFNALIDDQLTFTAGSDVQIMMATDFSMENAFTWCVSVWRGGGDGGDGGDARPPFNLPSP